jgi:hypothetical protein
MNVKDVTISLLGSAIVDLQDGDSPTTVYTVPTGKKAIPTMVVIRQPDASLAACGDVDFGDLASGESWMLVMNSA